MDVIVVRTHITDLYSVPGQRRLIKAFRVPVESVNTILFRYLRQKKIEY